MALHEFPVRAERTGWRDQEISARHRLWGFNCPAVDLDFLMVEYNHGKPVGLVEFKHYLAQFPNLLHATYRAIVDLADNYRPTDGREPGLPCLIAFYWPDMWAFRIHPLNDLARGWFAEGELITEREFVSRLYRIRHFAVEPSVLDRLSTALPGVVVVADFDELPF